MGGHRGLGLLSTVAVVLVAVMMSGLVETSASGQTVDEPVPRPVTPVLSARRFPAALVADADAELVAAVDAYANRVVGSTCAIVEVDGRRIVTRAPDTPLVPASTLKMATALAALDVLGPDRTLPTRFVSDGRVEKGVLEGDLWVVGGGDPILTTKGYVSVFEDPDQVSSDFGRIVDAIADLGITRITGSIIGDDSRYDDVRWIPTWPSRYQTGGTVSPLSALVVNDGNSGYSQSPDEPTTTRRVGDAPLLFVETLRTSLSQRGIAVGGGTATGPAPADATELGSVDSLPVIDLVGEMLLNSDNTTAELLTKEMGVVASGRGTTRDGLAAIRRSLEAEGIDVSALVMNDGSGLDTGNRATCSLMLELFERLSQTPELLASLPVGGRTGTLRRRMLSTPSMTKVRAKTGTLNGVNALAGLVSTNQGWTLDFTFLHSGNDVRATGVADGFTDRLVTYGARRPKESTLAPLPAR
ncbi:MAG: D-alanyl-D-alanine carboxypeptidase/D-alanyl-D-alanine-endopeptidase [Acidimicrobiia bacterium]|nr:D-alanyl-D-alanine carboxypeptidase/D-alanyl-D-alanine-endopeptidase [Acidimicrobiia bacterium]